MLNYRKRIVGVALVLIFVLPTLAGAAKEKVIVQKMDSAELKRMMQDPDNQRMIVAMASWCGPCRKELPTLIKLFNKYQGKGLKLVGISLDADGPEAMQRIIDKARVTFPVYWVGVDVAHEYGIYAIPMIFFIKKGEVVEKLPGQRSERFLEHKIIMLLKE